MTNSTLVFDEVVGTATNLDDYLTPGLYEFEADRIVCDDPPRVYPRSLVPLSLKQRRSVKILTQSFGVKTIQTIHLDDRETYVREFGGKGQVKWFRSVSGKIEPVPGESILQKEALQQTPPGSKSRALLVVTAKDEAPYIVDWICYHLDIGFDHILICSNNNQDSMVEIVKSIEATGKVSFRDNSHYVPIPDFPEEYLSNPQIRAYWRAIHEGELSNYEWVAFFDVDEFLVLHEHRTLSEFLREYREADAIAVNWRCFGSSGLLTYSDAPVIERFRYASARNWYFNGIVKTIAKCNSISNTSGGHLVTLRAGHDKYVYPNGLSVGPAHNPEIVDHSVAQLNHYSIKTPEEFVLRRSRGDVLIDKATMSPRERYNSGYYILNDADVELDVSVLARLEDFHIYKQHMLKSVAELEPILIRSEHETKQRIESLRSSIPSTIIDHVKLQAARLRA